MDWLVSMEEEYTWKWLEVTLTLRGMKRSTEVHEKWEAYICKKVKTVPDVI